MYVLSADVKQIIKGTLAVIEDAKKQRDDEEYIYYSISNAVTTLELILEEMEMQDHDS